MKVRPWKLLAFAAVGFLVSVNGYTAQTSKECSASSCEKSAMLSSEEKAFAEKLDEQNRKLFCNQFTAEQRKIAMNGQTGQNPNEAVQSVLNERNTALAETFSDKVEQKK